MENQHRQISGYRELAQGEIDLMNEIKALGPQIDAVLRKTGTHIATQFVQSAEGDDCSEYDRLASAQPERWIELAKDHLQQGLMALTRAVAQPTSF